MPGVRRGRRAPQPVLQMLSIFRMRSMGQLVPACRENPGTGKPIHPRASQGSSGHRDKMWNSKNGDSPNEQIRDEWHKTDEEARRDPKRKTGKAKLLRLPSPTHKVFYRSGDVVHHVGGNDAPLTQRCRCAVTGIAVDENAGPGSIQSPHSLSLKRADNT
jgi:hypothetical protein